MSSYLVVIEGDETTNFSAYCPDLPGVVATGATAEECVAEMQRGDRLPHRRAPRRRRAGSSAYQPRGDRRSRCLTVRQARSAVCSPGSASSG